MENQNKVIITRFVRNKIRNLLKILIEENYFSFEENAQVYISDLINFMFQIPELRHHHSPNEKFGKWYCRYKPNKHTTWYITFDTDGETYLVKNIINNHTRDYASFLRMIE